MLLIVAVLSLLLLNSNGLDFKYHSNLEIKEYLKYYNNKYDLKTRTYSIGTTYKDNDLMVIEIDMTNSTKLAIPNVKLIGNIHGNEAIGREILLQFLEYLGENYLVDPTVTWLLKNTKLHIMPTLNPDGYDISSVGVCDGEYGRTNSKNTDLNRNFPDYFHERKVREQLETSAIRKWMNDVPFILSASLHSGALVANYPFDSEKESKWEKLIKDIKIANNQDKIRLLGHAYIESMAVNPPSISPDDDVFKYLATVYSNSHTTMHLEKKCIDLDPIFHNGITNGAAWYSFIGGMQDYNYAMHGCMELTLELSCCKHPKPADLEGLWLQNKNALLDFCIQANRGVKGVINNEIGLPIKDASLKIIGREMGFTTSKNGEFWRILMPGTYKLEVIASGYHKELIDFSVKQNANETYPEATELVICLQNINSTTTTIIKTSTTFVPKTFNDHFEDVSPHNLILAEDTPQPPLQLITYSSAIHQYDYCVLIFTINFIYYYIF